MKLFLVLGFLVGMNSAAQAADTMLLEPVHVTCVLAHDSQGIAKGDIYYKGLKIHLGRAWTSEIGRGDYYKCMGLVEAARDQNSKLIFTRDCTGTTCTSWEKDELLVLASTKACE